MLIGLKKLSIKILIFLGFRKSIPGKILDQRLIGAIHFGDINNINIGDNVSFGGDVILYANAPIEIGNNTMIAPKVIFHTSTHDHNDHPMWMKRIDRPIKIGQHVWIGIGAIILPGVVVGDYSVIAAGSIVIANVPKGAIVGGNPAKIIKYRKENVYLNEPSITSWEEGKIIYRDYLSIDCKKSE